MKSKPLNPELLIEYNDYFTENNAIIDILDDFFYHMITLVDIDENVNLSGNIRDIVQDMNFNSRDELNNFIGKYTGYSNSIVSFFEKLETIEDPDEKEVLVRELYYTFLDIYEDDLKRIVPIITSKALETINVILGKYDLYPEEDDEDLEKFRSEVDTYFGENYSYIFLSIFGVIDKIKTEPDNVDEVMILTLFLLLVILVMNMNILRKEELTMKMMEREKFQNVGRNEPCPCGSGLKFKKCCLLKLY